MSMEKAGEPPFPFEGCDGWALPIRMQYQIYSHSLSRWIRQAEDFQSAAAFRQRHGDIVRFCMDMGSAADFKVECVWQGHGTDRQALVYDFEAKPEEPKPEEPKPEEPKPEEPKPEEPKPEEPKPEEPKPEEPKPEEPKPEEPKPEEPKPEKPKPESPAPDADAMLQGILERLDKIAARDGKDLTERLDSLLLLLAPPEEDPPAEASLEDGPAAYFTAVPFEGWENWTAPIRMEFQIYSYGMGRWIRQAESFQSPEAFRARYEEITAFCLDVGKPEDFKVEYIWQAHGTPQESLVYDFEAQAQEPEPDPGQPEQPGGDLDGTAQRILEALKSIDSSLTEMDEAEKEYRLEMEDYRKDLSAMQAAQTANGVITCVALFALLGQMAVAQLIRRLK